MQEWKQFENKARKACESKFRCKLPEEKVVINGKDKKFDLVNKEKGIVGDVKFYRNTSGGNIPSAKRSTANEYVWLLQKTKGFKKKMLVMGEDMAMAEKYVSDFAPWIEGVEVYFFRRDKELKKIFP